MGWLSGQLYALASLLLGKDSLVPIKLTSEKGFFSFRYLIEDVDTDNTLKRIREKICT
jgi:hypothetical protein